MESQNSEEPSFTQIITVITICAFLLGIIYPVVYYSFFSFNVFDYIELNEVITHTITAAVIISIPYVFLLLLITKIPKSKVVNSTFFNKSFWGKTLLIKSIYWSGIIVVIAGYIYLFYTKKISLPFFLLCLLTILWVVYLVELPKKLKNTLNVIFNTQMNSFYYIFISALVITVYGGIVQSLIKVDSVKFQHLTKGSYIVREKDTIKSTNSYYYIGKTNKFVFFYNEKNDLVTAYPESTIKVYSLKK